MEKKIRTMIAGLVVVFVATSTGYAMECCPMAICHAKEMKAHWKTMAKKLNLTAEQEDKLKENQKKQRQEVAHLFKALKQEHEKLQTALGTQGTTTAEDIKPIVDKIKEIQASLVDQRIKGILTVKEILTPAQFAKFQQMVKKRQEQKKECIRHEFQKKRYHPGGPPKEFPPDEEP